MKYTQWMTYKGKRILYVNLSKKNEVEVKEALREYLGEAKAQPGSPSLMDFSGTVMSKITQQAGKEMTLELERFMKDKGIQPAPTAIVGLSLLGRTVASLISASELNYYANTLDDAKEWLFQHC